MNQFRVLAIGLLAAGIVLFYAGWQESRTVGSRMARLVQDAPTDATWMMIGGAIAAGVGVVMLVSRRR